MSRFSSSREEDCETCDTMQQMARMRQQLMNRRRMQSTDQQRQEKDEEKLERVVVPAPSQQKLADREDRERNDENRVENGHDQVEYSAIITDADAEEKWRVNMPPPDLFDLGNSGWTLIHTIAAYYPEEPSTEKQNDTRAFFDIFSRVYPCSYCAEDLRERMRDNPPRVSSRRELSQWSCEIHNEINEMLGKPQFPCDEFDRRWRISKDAFS